MNGHCGVYCQSCVLKGIFYISSSRCLFTTTLFVLICLDSTYMFGKHAIRRHFQRYPADQRRWRIQKKTHGRSGFVSGKQFWRKQRQVVTSRCHSSNISGFQHTMVLQKREKLTCMTFLCVIAHQEQNEAHTFLPSFDNSDGRLCQERLRSRNRATLVTWRHNFSTEQRRKSWRRKSWRWLPHRLSKRHVTVNNNIPIQDYVHPNDKTQSTFEMTRGYKPFTELELLSTLMWLLVYCNSRSCFVQQRLRIQSCVLREKKQFVFSNFVLHHIVGDPYYNDKLISWIRSLDFSLGI